MIDWTVHLGDLLQMGGFIVAALTLFTYMRISLENHTVRLSSVERDLTDINQELKQQTAILLQLAKDGVRLDGLEKRVELLERALTSAAPKQ